MRCHLLEPRVDYTPDFKQPTLLARLVIVGRTTPSPSELQMFSILGEEGKTHRTPRLNALPCESQALQSEAGEQGICLRFVENAFLRGITTSMLQTGDRMYFQRECECEDLRSWLGLRSAYSAQAGNFVTWQVSAAEAASFGRTEIEQPPALAVLCTKHDDVRDWLDTGQALARVQLRALSLGLSLAVFNQPLQVPGMRARFARETGFCNFPQVVVRLGLREALTAAAQDPCDCGCGGDCEGGDIEGSSRHR
jgi:hypothetical protein